MKKQMKWWLPFLLLILFIPFSPLLDMHVSSWFYDGDSFSQHPYYKFMYVYGEKLGFLLYGLAWIYLIGSIFKKGYRSYRHEAWMIILTLSLGAGLITNVICKNVIGRPRPKQVVEFGGKYLHYLPLWELNLDPNRSPQKSFPSGHVAMGFSSFGILLGARRKGPYYYLGWLLTLGWAIPLILTRVAQGGHFLSDTLVSVWLMWNSALVCSLFLDWAKQLEYRWIQNLVAES
jgi:lipid A 4'-phosphatase